MLLSPEKLEAFRVSSPGGRVPRSYGPVFKATGTGGIMPNVAVLSLRFGVTMGCSIKISTSYW